MIAAWIILVAMLLAAGYMLMFGGAKPSVLDDVKGVGKQRYW